MTAKRCGASWSIPGHWAHEPAERGPPAPVFDWPQNAVIPLTCHAVPDKLLAGTIPQPHGTEVRRILREYVDERLRWAGTPVAREGPSAKALLARLSIQMVGAGARSPGAVDVFLASATRILELHEMRVMVRERGRIPPGLWFVLLLVAVLALAAMGYHGGIAGRKRSPVMPAVALAFSAVIMLIADLDRPGEGWINVSQQPMLDLREALAEAKD